MRAVVQRVKSALVQVDGEVVGHINKGLLVYLSVGKTDLAEDAEYMADKLVNLRIFADDTGRMNQSICDVGGAVLLVSNFTLHGDCRKGRRPGFDEAAKPELGNDLYAKVASLIVHRDISVEKGVFGAHMQVTSVNDGPVTFLLDSCKQF
ncbi:MAG: D-tyrosyl-tRNA(Tyr) deacylase [Sedimentisphaerales bacterium]|nr:D-tyrosyl-tRNA(Tyr) deacylase [Sedimentisphaerales bacterium]